MSGEGGMKGVNSYTTLLTHKIQSNNNPLRFVHLSRGVLLYTFFCLLLLLKHNVDIAGADNLLGSFADVALLGRATCVAAVSFLGVAVVAFLPGIGDAVAAAYEAAFLCGLRTMALAWFPCADEALLHDADAGTAVSVVILAVIAVLAECLVYGTVAAGLMAETRGTGTRPTGKHGTAGGTAVVIPEIAVVTLFAFIDRGVSAVTLHLSGEPVISPHGCEPDCEEEQKGEEE